MSTATFERTYARDVPELVLDWQAQDAPAPSVVALDADVAGWLGLDPAWLRSPAGLELLTGRAGGTAALAYAGHQFGSYSPRLGDGRAVLLGEVTTTSGERVDLHAKGTGRTPFARGGDGNAVLGPMLREHVMAGAMHALGVPTTRSLAVVATGATIRGGAPAAVLVRTASSHLRIGTFEYAARLGDPDVLQRLVDHAIDRHHPTARDHADPALGLLLAVVEAQAALVARWMHLGFVHGVLNTDNVTIAGETIDYGPCAFMDRHDPATVFSSIDHAGRYAYGNQPAIVRWDLARLAETLLPLVDGDAVEVATDAVQSFGPRYERHWHAGMDTRLGLAAGDHHDDLHDELVGLMAEQRMDHSGTFRALADVLRGDRSSLDALADDPAALDTWIERWGERVVVPPDALDDVNPAVVPRNHRVEAALAAAEAGDLAPFEQLLAAVTHPYEPTPGFTDPAPEAFTTDYRTFCGT